MDSARLFLTDFRLRTASSSVRADASADASVLDRSPQARLRLSLKADVDLPEIAHLFPVGDTLRNLAAGKTPEPIFRVRSDGFASLRRKWPFPGSLPFRSTERLFRRPSPSGFPETSG